VDWSLCLVSNICVYIKSNKNIEASANQHSLNQHLDRNSSTHPKDE